VPGVVAAVVAAASWIGAQVAAVAAWTVAGIQIGSFIISSIISFGLSKLLAPKVKGNDRQADALQLNLGENPREALFGTVATGGQLVDAANKTRYSGYDNGAEILVIKLADHEIDSLVGFYVNDEYVPWTGSGTYHAFDNSFVEGLRVYLQTGTQTQTVPSYVTTGWSSFWPTTKTMKGCAHVFVEYADTKDRDIWPAGRPRFVWVVKGAKLYDPRKDSTVSGGSGSHRWGTPSTYEWSDNAYLCRYNWVRGIFNGTHLMVGRGLTAIEAPPERAIARANTCDETVSLKAGGTEKRYRANGLVKSTDTAIDVEEWFAAAMAGDLVDRDGVVDIDPGEARTPVWTITDGDMLDGETRVYNRHLGENQRVNTVVARYVEPTQRYEAVAAPMRRDAADVTADGRPYETTLDLQFVQSGTQAQRIAEIKRRQGRLERSFQCTVGPRYIGAESGDWVTLTSDRWLGGDSIVCVITAVQIGVDFKVTLGLREIASSVYSWTAASDELTPGTVVASSTSAPAAISVTSFAAAAAVLTTAAGSVPAIQCTWAAFTDASVTGVLLQVRKSGETTITPTTMSDATVLEAFVTAGVGAQQAMQVRAKAISNVPGRKSNWTSWTNVTTGGSAIDNALVGVGGNACVNSEFENGLTGWEEAWNGDVGATPVRSRVVGGINYVQAVVTGTPANNTVFDIYETDRSLALYWDGVADLATIRRSFMPVASGQRVFASAPVAYENAQYVSMNLVFHDKDGVDIGSAGLAQGGTNGFPTGGNPALFTIIGGFATAPANAAYVGVYARVVCSGAANPKGYVGGRVQLCVVPDGQTAWPPYSPGPSDKQATKGAIIGQNLLRPDTTLPGLVDLENSWNSFTPVRVWNFENGLEGWSGAGATVSISGGVLLWQPTTTNAQLYSLDGLGLNGAAENIIRIRARPLAASPTWEGVIYYSTSGHDISGGYYKVIANPGIVQNEWRVFEFDMRTLSVGGTNWITSTIRRLRIDITNSQQDWEFDWIAIGSYKFSQQVSGGTNLVKRTDWTPGHSYTLAAYVASGVANGKSGWGITLNKTTGNTAIAFGAYKAWPSGREFTLSFTAWISAGVAIIDTDLYPDTLPGLRCSLTTTPTRFQLTINSAHADMASAAWRFFCTDSPADGDTITITDLQMEYGPLATDWTPPVERVQYVSDSGQIDNYRGLPINAIGPFGITRSVYDVIGATIPTTQITIVSHTVYAPGGNISVTGGTITGLTASTIYDCFWRISNSTLSAEVAGSTAANEKRAHPDYLWLATGEPGAAANEEQGIDRLSYGNYL